MAVRKLYNFLYGSLVAPLSESATTINFGRVLPVELLETQDGKEYVPLVISPDTEPEIVHLVEYEPGETSGTVLRGREGTHPASHSPGAPWGCKPLVADIEGSGGSVTTFDGTSQVLDRTKFLSFGRGLTARQLDFRTVQVDAEGADEGILLEGVATFPFMNPDGTMRVELEGRWGIDQETGDPYFDPSNADPSDVSALLFYPAPEEYRLTWLGVKQEVSFPTGAMLMGLEDGIFLLGAEDGRTPFILDQLAVSSGGDSLDVDVSSASSIYKIDVILGTASERNYGRDSQLVLFNTLLSTPSADEDAFIAMLNDDGFTVDQVDDDEVMSVDHSDYGLVIIRAPGDLYTAHPQPVQDIAIPLISMSRHTSRVALGMSSGSGGNSGDVVTRIASHAVGDGLDSPLTVQNITNTQSISTLSAGVELLWSNSSATAAGIALRASDWRMHYGIHRGSSYTSDGEALFLSAVAYMMSAS